ncbi:MAG: hypothetical protein V1725_00335 [archaeon]
MSSWIMYEGDSLGRFKFDEFGNIVFVTDSLADLVRMLTLPEDAILDVEGNVMTYRQFINHDLKRVQAFYPTLEDYLFKNHPKEKKEYLKTINQSENFSSISSSSNSSSS